MLADLLHYIVTMSNKFVNIKKFRVECLQLVVKAYEDKEDKESSEWLALSQCYFQLDMFPQVAQLLVSLITK